MDYRDRPPQRRTATLFNSPSFSNLPSSYHSDLSDSHGNSLNGLHHGEKGKSFHGSQHASPHLPNSSMHQGSIDSSTTRDECPSPLHSGKFNGQRSSLLMRSQSSHEGRMGRERKSLSELFYPSSAPSSLPDQEQDQASNRHFPENGFKKNSLSRLMNSSSASSDYGYKKNSLSRLMNSSSASSDFYTGADLSNNVNDKYDDMASHHIPSHGQSIGQTPLGYNWAAPFSPAHQFFTMDTGGTYQQTNACEDYSYGNHNPRSPYIHHYWNHDMVRTGSHRFELDSRSIYAKDETSPYNYSFLKPNDLEVRKHTHSSLRARMINTPEGMLYNLPAALSNHHASVNMNHSSTNKMPQTSPAHYHRGADYYDEQPHDKIRFHMVGTQSKSRNPNQRVPRPEINNAMDSPSHRSIPWPEMISLDSPSYYDMGEHQRRSPTGFKSDRFHSGPEQQVYCSLCSTNHYFDEHSGTETRARSVSRSGRFNNIAPLNLPQNVSFDHGDDMDYLYEYNYPNYGLYRKTVIPDLEDSLPRKNAHKQSFNGLEEHRTAYPLQDVRENTFFHEKTLKTGKTKSLSGHELDVIDNILRKITLSSWKPSSWSTPSTSIDSARAVARRVLLLQAHALKPEFMAMAADKKRFEAQRWALMVQAGPAAMANKSQLSNSGLRLLHLQKRFLDIGKSTFELLWKLRDHLRDTATSGDDRGSFKIACVGGGPGCTAISLRLFFLMMLGSSLQVEVDICSSQRDYKAVVDKICLSDIKFPGVDIFSMMRSNPSLIRHYKMLILVNCYQEAITANEPRSLIRLHWNSMWDVLHHNARPGTLVVVYESSPTCPWDEIAPTAIADWEFTTIPQLEGVRVARKL